MVDAVGPAGPSVGGAEVEAMETATAAAAVVRVQGIAEVLVLHNGLASAAGGGAVVGLRPGP